jgi:hypothetical protein
MSTKYKKFRSFLLPKEIVDLLFISSYTAPLENNKESEIIVGLAVINDILFKSNQNRKHEDYSFHFIPMASTYLKLKYGNDYKNYFHWLIMNKIVWRDEYHEGKATSYYLHSIDAYEDFISNLLKENLEIIKEEIINTYCISNNIEISLESLDIKGIDAIQKNRIFNKWYRIKVPITKTNRGFLVRDYEEDSKYINNAPTHIKKMGSHFRKNLAIDYDKAMAHAANRYKEELTLSKNQKEEFSAYKRYSSRICSINAINNGGINKSLRFKRNDTNKRLDTNLTNMASDLRKFIIGYEKMSYLDLSNSQPVLFNILLIKHKDKASKELQMEMDLYLEVTVSGKWYEWLQELYGLSRNECKEIWMKIAYSENVHNIQVKSKFKEALPNIYAMIEKIKEKNHEQFAVELQNIESEIFIDEICRELVNQNIIPYTMHDGLLVPNESEQKTLDIMSSILKKHLGAVPNIKVEN